MPVAQFRLRILPPGAALPNHPAHRFCHTAVITGLVAVIWVYFGRLYLIHDPGEWRIANQQLGYPLYIIPLIGVTHILGGVGLLIPNVGSHFPQAPRQQQTT